MYRTILSTAYLLIAGCASSPSNTALPPAPESLPDSELQAGIAEVREVELSAIAGDRVCRKEIPTGSRITVRRCVVRSNQELDDIVRDELLREQMDREARRHATRRRRGPNDIL